MLQRLAVRIDRASGGALAVDSSGTCAVLGGRRALCLVELDWPWEPSRVLNLSNGGDVIALEWQNQSHRRQVVACAESFGSLRLYDVSASSCAAALVATGVIETEKGAADSAQESHAVDAVGWCPNDGNLLAVHAANGSAALWDIRSPSAMLSAANLLGGVPTEPKGAGVSASASHPACQGAICWSARSGYCLAFSRDGEVVTVDVRVQSRPLAHFAAHGSSVHSLDWRSSLLSGDADGDVKLWHAEAEAAVQPQCVRWLRSGLPLGQSALLGGEARLAQHDPARQRAAHFTLRHIKGSTPFLSAASPMPSTCPRERLVVLSERPPERFKYSHFTLFRDTFTYNRVVRGEPLPFSCASCAGTSRRLSGSERAA
uniref:Peroxin-7 n=1 Tax=Chrysotila carterae TaxID=13221 RepID=A0A7S4BKM3_CHRCT